MLNGQSLQIKLKIEKSWSRIAHVRRNWKHIMPEWKYDNTRDSAARSVAGMAHNRNQNGEEKVLDFACMPKRLMMKC